MGIVSRKPLTWGVAMVAALALLALILVSTASATTYLYDGPILTNDHTDGDDNISHDTYIKYWVPDDDGEFRFEAVNVKKGGRPPPSEWYSWNEKWSSKKTKYRRWDADNEEWVTVRTHGEGSWRSDGEIGDLDYVDDPTNVTMVGGALIEHYNRYGWNWRDNKGKKHWTEWRGRTTHRHYLEEE